MILNPNFTRPHAIDYQIHRPVSLTIYNILHALDLEKDHFNLLIKIICQFFLAYFRQPLSFHTEDEFASFILPG